MVIYTELETAQQQCYKNNMHTYTLSSLDERIVSLPSGTSGEVHILYMIDRPTDRRIKCVLHMDLQGAPVLHANVAGLATFTHPECVYSIPLVSVQLSIKDHARPLFFRP